MPVLLDEAVWQSHHYLSVLCAMAAMHAGRGGLIILTRLPMQSLEMSRAFRWLTVQAAYCDQPTSELPLTGLSMAVQPSMLRCRVRATEAVGIIVAAVGMDVLGGALQEFVAAALQVGVPSAVLPA